MFARIHSAAIIGLECKPVIVEIYIGGGWPHFQVVGLPGTAIQEARERIKAAWKNTGLPFPHSSRIVANLAPADLRKEGTLYDLPIAAAMYLSHKHIQKTFSDSLFIGELALNGEVRRTNSILPVALFAQRQGHKNIFVPAANAREAGLAEDITIYPVKSFKQLIAHIQGTSRIPPYCRQTELQDTLFARPSFEFDMAHIKGQHFAKRALEIAASGGHNILLNGPPGSGKTLLARTLPSIMPTMTIDEAIEITKIYSVSGLLPADQPLITERPFRSPHHSASGIALVGGGGFPKPGEISLAHRGVLFLDELPEFNTAVLEYLRQPLEDGVVTISRSQRTITYPARFTLVASQNPCPCGYATDPDSVCTCPPHLIERYRKKISGPLLDRFDMFVEVPRVPFEHLSAEEDSEPSRDIQLRVTQARALQQERFKKAPRENMPTTNAELKSEDVRRLCRIDEAAAELIRRAMHSMKLSARGYYKTMKLSRTIADMAHEKNIRAEHVAEALQYRQRSGSDYLLT